MFLNWFCFSNFFLEQVCYNREFCFAHFFQSRHDLCQKILDLGRKQSTFFLGLVTYNANVHLSLLDCPVSLLYNKP